jgi:hypothetical protein
MEIACWELAPLISPFYVLFLLLFRHLCKYANTTKCSPSCAYVLAFHKHFIKGLALSSPRHSILATMQS